MEEEGREKEGDDFGVQSLTNDFKSGIWTRHFGAKVFHGTGSLDLAAMPSRQFLLGDGYLQCWLKQHT